MAEDELSIPSWILEEFQAHTSNLRKASAARKESVALRNIVEDKADRQTTSVEETLGRRQPGDVYEGDVNIRTLRLLLGMIDQRGWERSEHQLLFHSAFERCVARVLYKNEWQTMRPAIMKHNDWKTCSSEVMISTPRRFASQSSVLVWLFQWDVRSLFFLQRDAQVVSCLNESLSSSVSLTASRGFANLIKKL